MSHSLVNSSTAPVASSTAAALISRLLLLTACKLQN